MSISIIDKEISTPQYADRKIKSRITASRVVPEIDAVVISIPIIIIGSIIGNDRTEKIVPFAFAFEMIAEIIVVDDEIAKLKIRIANNNTPIDFGVVDPINKNKSEAVK